MNEFEDVLILIQARMGSTRLPGKVLLPFGSSTIIGYLYNKLLKAKFSVNQICIATTTNTIDNELIKYLKKLNIQYFSGSENNVLSRYQEASKIFNKNIIVRLTADNPLIDANLLKCCIRFHMNGLYNVTSTRKIELNRKVNRFLPKGSSIDIFEKKTLLEISHDNCDEFEKEHVIPALFKHNNYKVNLFQIGNLKRCGIDFNDIIAMSIDTKSDYEKACDLIKEIR